MKIMDYQRMPAGLVVFAVTLFLSVAASAQGSWRENRPMENGRSHLAAATIGEEVYVAGGAGVLGPVDAFELYDSIADFWIPLPTLPGGREQFGMAATGGKIFISGGFVKDQSGRASSELWIFETQSDQWRKALDMPSARAGHVMVAVGAKLYVMGGLSSEDTSIFIFNTATAKWSTAPYSMASTRRGIAAAVEGSNVYLIGGSPSQGSASARVDALDVASGTWRRLADLPSPRMGAAATMLGGQLHVAGGATFNPGRTYRDHFVYDPTGNKWHSSLPLPTPRFASGSANVNGQWYVIGGGVGTGFLAPFTASDAVETFVP